MTLAQPKTYPRDWKVTGAALSMLVAGIIHILIIPAPFTNEAEEVDFSGVFTKILEAISAAALTAVVVNAAPELGAGRSARRTLITILLISLLLAMGVYEVARAGQPLFSQLSPPGMDNMEMEDHE